MRCGVVSMCSVGTVLGGLEGWEWDLYVSLDWEGVICMVGVGLMFLVVRFVYVLFLAGMVISVGYVSVA